MVRVRHEEREKVATGSAVLTVGFSRAGYSSGPSTICMGHAVTLGDLTVHLDYAVAIKRRTHGHNCTDRGYRLRDRGLAYFRAAFAAAGAKVIAPFFISASTISESPGATSPSSNFRARGSWMSR